MSKYKVIKSQIRDRIHITTALDQMGVPYEVAGDGAELPLYGYLGDRRPETGTVVVRRKDISDNSNDIGWSLDSETGAYNLILSEYDNRLNQARRIAQGVAQRAALAALQEAAMIQGFQVRLPDDLQVRLGGSS